MEFSYKYGLKHDVHYGHLTLTNENHKVQSVTVRW